MRFDGVLTSWNEQRGFGFIEADQGGDKIFVHVKAIVNRHGRPQIGQRVSFEIEPGPKGKKRAKNVLPTTPAKPIGPRRGSPADSPAKWGTATLLAIPAFVLVYGVVTLIWRTPSWVALFYLVAGVVTYAAYGWDKAAARHRRWRTSESTLHLLSLAGGWPGALLAQQLLRHKSTKAAFRTAFWFTVVANVVAFVLLCSPWVRLLAPSGR